MKVAFILLALAAAAAAAAADVYGKPAYNSGYKSADYAAPAHYKVDWAVKDDYYNDFGQQEARDGDKTTGSWWVNLPDGRRQTVKYYVDGYSGLVADVSYDGYAKSYDYKPTYNAPSYSRPVSY